jgi:hypothetical protein
MTNVLLQITAKTNKNSGVLPQKETKGENLLSLKKGGNNPNFENLFKTLSSKNVDFVKVTQNKDSINLTPLISNVNTQSLDSNSETNILLENIEISDLLEFMENIIELNIKTIKDNMSGNVPTFDKESLVNQLNSLTEQLSNLNQTVKNKPLNIKSLFSNQNEINSFIAQFKNLPINLQNVENKSENLSKLIQFIVTTKLQIDSINMKAFNNKNNKTDTVNIIKTETDKENNSIKNSINQFSQKDNSVLQQMSLGNKSNEQGSASTSNNDYKNLLNILKKFSFDISKTSSDLEGNPLFSRTVKVSKEQDLLMPKNNIQIESSLVKKAFLNSLNSGSNITIKKLSIDFSTQLIESIENFRVDQVNHKLNFENLIKSAEQSLNSKMSAESGNPTRPLFNNIIQQLNKATFNINKLSVTLRPASLGELNIDVNVDKDGIVRAVIKADNPIVLDAMRNDRHQLLSILKENGLNVTSDSLEFEQNNNNSSNEDSDQKQNTSLTSDLYTDASEENEKSDEIQIITDNQIDIVT